MDDLELDPKTLAMFALVKKSLRALEAEVIELGFTRSQATATIHSKALKLCWAFGVPLEIVNEATLFSHTLLGEILREAEEPNADAN